MTVTITAAMLRAKGACADQREKFEALWPNGYEAATIEQFTADCVEHAGAFDWGWAAAALLAAPAQAEYKRATAPALAEYKRATAPAWAEYVRVTAAAWAEYVRATAPALAEYKRATAPAWAEYKRATAAAFARAHWEQRGLLASIADDACSLGCPSYQPPGAPPLTHTERCIAVRAALNNGEEE